MTTERGRSISEAARRLLRTVKVGDRVRTTAYASRRGETGVVVDVNPYAPDGARRVSVKYDSDGVVVAVFPTSIEVIR